MTSYRGRLAQHDDAGMTLIEIVIAMFVLGILTVAVLGILFASQKSSVDSRNRVAASNLAAREIDLVRERFLASDDGPLTVAAQGVVTNPNPIAGGTAGQPIQVDGTAYTVRRSATWNITGSGTSACEGGTAVDHPTLVIHVEVTWPEMGTTKPVTNQTQLAPERGQGLPTTASFVAVAVKDSRGEPSSGRTVVVSSSAESRSAVTDASGCAVVAVNPPTGGADYTARFPDAGFVDISGTSNPERLIGRVNPGQMVSNVQIALDRAGEVTIRMTGGSLSDADVDGSTVSLFQSEASGSSTVMPYVLSGRDTLVTGLWPTNYGAFFGTEVPPTITNMTTLPPGGSIVIEVEFQYATFVVTNLPTSGDVIAAPVGEACTAPTARTINPSSAELPPGEWDFFLENTDFGCAEGPAGVVLVPGPNAPVEWETSTLRVNGTPNEGMPVWAVSAGVAGSSCDSAGGRAVELGMGGGSVGPVELPAGDWFVFAMPDSSGQPDGTPCIDAGLVAVPYGLDTVFSWPAGSSTLRVVDVPDEPGNYRVVASTSSSLTCSTSSTNPAGAIIFSPANSETQQSILSQGTWYIYRQRTSPWYLSGNQCTGGLPVTIGWAPLYELDFDDGTVTTP